MEASKYLPIGTAIAKKYEVIDVLGEDEFEILYLVRDLHRKGSFFVLKELFLETFSTRNNNIVDTLPVAEGVFNKRKKQIIEEIEVHKLNLNFNEIKIYGYEEDYGTVYTIMEFSNNASLEKYLFYSPKDANALPTLEELLKEKNKSSNISFFVKIILTIGILSAMAFYAYSYFTTQNHENDFKQLSSSKKLDYPILRDRKAVEKEINHTIEPLIEPIIEKKLEENISTVVKVIEEVNSTKNEKNLSILIEKHSEIVEIEENVTEINTTIIEPKKENNIMKEVSIDLRIKSFLDNYINASARGSVADTLSYYDTNIIRYFKLRNVTQEVIAKGQEKYNKKWINRDFQIVDFEIIKTYQKENVNYFDVKTLTIWAVSNEKSKKLSGESRGFMTLKEVEKGFKIISIYTIK